MTKLKILKTNYWNLPAHSKSAKSRGLNVNQFDYSTEFDFVQSRVGISGQIKIETSTKMVTPFLIGIN